MSFQKLVRLLIPTNLWVKKPNLICMILVYRTIFGARKISPLPCSLQAISQNSGFWGPRGLGYSCSQFYWLSSQTWNYASQINVLSMCSRSFPSPYNAWEKRARFCGIRGLRVPLPIMQYIRLWRQFIHIHMSWRRHCDSFAWTRAPAVLWIGRQFGQPHAR